MTRKPFSVLLVSALTASLMGSLVSNRIFMHEPVFAAKKPNHHDFNPMRNRVSSFPRSGIFTP